MMLYAIGSQTVLHVQLVERVCYSVIRKGIHSVCLSKGWVSNKWPPVSHLLHSIWPSSLSTCFTGGPLSSGEENREVKEQQDK